MNGIVYYVVFCDWLLSLNIMFSKFICDVVFIGTSFFFHCWILLISCSVMSDSLQSHELQNARLPCPSPSPGAFSNSCPLSQWMPSNHLILCHPLLLLPSIFLSISVFSNELALRIRWPKYWSFSFSTSPSFRIDWFDLLALQETLKSLRQYHSSKATSIL